MATKVKKFQFTTWDALVFGALVALVWGKSAQTILLAVIAFLLYLLVRSQFSRSAPLPVSAPSNNEFVVEDERDSHARIDLDTDIDFQARRNHFRLDSQFDTAYRDAEYEYKIEGTNVFVRLLNESLEDIGLAKTWEVRDGVLLEADYRERLKANKFVSEQDREEEIADRKKALEWHEVLPSYWNGLKYFILWKNMPRDDAHRYLRQEMERLKLGDGRFIEAAGKIGYVRDDTSDWRLRLPEGVNPTEEERERLFASTSSFGISRDEFLMAPGLIAALEKYCA